MSRHRMRAQRQRAQRPRPVEVCGLCGRWAPLPYIGRAHFLPPDTSAWALREFGVCGRCRDVERHAPGFAAAAVASRLGEAAR